MEVPCQMGCPSRPSQFLGKENLMVSHQQKYSGKVLKQLQKVSDRSEFVKKTGHGHDLYKFCFGNKIEEKCFTQRFGGSPSDPRYEKNFRADVRRKLREVGQTDTSMMIGFVVKKSPEEEEKDRAWNTLWSLLREDDN